MDPDSDPDPAIFVIDLQYASKKIFFQHNFFCLLLFEATFASFFTDKKSKKYFFNTIFSAYYFLKLHLHHFSKIKVKKSHKILGIKGFLFLFLHDDRRIRIRIREAHKHVDPDPDSDLQHCPLPSPPPQPHTLFILYILFEKGGRGEEVREKVQ
jgi:hypothetical protein